MTSGELNVKDIARLITDFYKKKRGTYGKRALSKFAKELVFSFEDKNFVKKLSWYMYLYSCSPVGVSKIENYMRSLYFSRETYKEFDKLKPIEVVRYVRFYLGKKGKIPLSLTPYLLKKARLIKRAIKGRIRYHLKKNIFLTEEDVYQKLRASVKGERLRKRSA